MTGRPARIRAGRRRTSGAALVEYALAVSIVLLAATSGARYLETEAAADVDNQGNCISTRPPPAACQTRALSPSAGGGGSGGAGGGGQGERVPAVASADVDDVVTQGSLFRVVVRVRVVDDSGDPVVGEIVSSQVTVRDSNPSWREGAFFFVDCTTEADGACVASFDSRWPDVEVLRFEIVTVGVDTSYEFPPVPPIDVVRP